MTLKTIPCFIAATTALCTTKPVTDASTCQMHLSSQQHFLFRTSFVSPLLLTATNTTIQSSQLLRRCVGRAIIKSCNDQSDVGAAMKTSTTSESHKRGRCLTASKSSAPLIDEHDGEPLLHVVFVHPQIHWNTGNIGRTCLGLGARLHLVGPLGFSLDARQIRRAGLDYWNHVDVNVYKDWAEFANGPMQHIKGTRYFFTKFGDQCITDLEWAQNDKIVLIFGSEIDGFDGIREWLDTEGRQEKLIAFPMVDDRFRSFNLSTTASMALWDAYKSLKQRLAN